MPSRSHQTVPPVAIVPDPRMDTGARRLTADALQAESGAVDAYLSGDFVFAEQLRAGRGKSAYLRLGQHTLTLSSALIAQLPQGLETRRIMIGVDAKRRLLMVAPTDDVGSRTWALGNKRGQRFLVVRNQRLAQWLAAQGVPVGVTILARWQPQTQSIVGRWPA